MTHFEALGRTLTGPSHVLGMPFMSVVPSRPVGLTRWTGYAGFVIDPFRRTEGSTTCAPPGTPVGDALPLRRPDVRTGAPTGT